MSSPRPTPMLLFVYGSLKRIEPMHHWMEDRAKGKGTFLANGKTKIKYPLVKPTEQGIPFFHDVPGVGHHVEGEVYEIDAARLKHLDVFEGYPDFFTRREEVVVIDRDDDFTQEAEAIIRDKNEVTCQMYLPLRPKPELLTLPHLTKFSANGLPIILPEGFEF